MAEDQATRLRQLVGGKLNLATADSTDNKINQLSNSDFLANSSEVLEEGYFLEDNFFTAERLSSEELAKEANLQAAEWANITRSNIALANDEDISSQAEPTNTDTDNSTEVKAQAELVEENSPSEPTSVDDYVIAAESSDNSPVNRETEAAGDTEGLEESLKDSLALDTYEASSLSDTDALATNLAMASDVVIDETHENYDAYADDTYDTDINQQAVAVDSAKIKLETDSVAEDNNELEQAEDKKKASDDEVATEKEFFGDIFYEEKNNTWANVRVIAITSGKGGVGKTNVTLNLAIALGKLGKRVLVIDADIGMANIDVLLGNTSNHYLLDLLKDDIELSDVVMSGAFGVKYIVGGSGIDKVLEYDRAEKIILQKKLAGCASLADVILVDTGAGLGRNVMDFILAADEVLLVTTPEPTSLTDAYAVMKAYSIYAEHKNINLIVNRVYEQGESREVVAKLQHAAARFLNMPVGCLGYIYEDSSVSKAVRKQTPFSITAPNGAATRCIEGLAQGLLTGKEMAVKRGWKGFLRNIFDF